MKKKVLSMSSSIEFQQFIGITHLDHFVGIVQGFKPYLKLNLAYTTPTKKGKGAIYRSISISSTQTSLLYYY